MSQQKNTLQGTGHNNMKTTENFDLRQLLRQCLDAEVVAAQAFEDLYCAGQSDVYKDGSWVITDLLAGRIFELTPQYPHLKPLLDHAIECVKALHDLQEQLPQTDPIHDLDWFLSAYSYIHGVDVTQFSREQLLELPDSPERDSIITCLERFVQPELTHGKRQCPHCRSERLESKGKSRHGKQRLKCKTCGKSHSVDS